MSIQNLFNGLFKYKIDDYVVYIGPKKDQNAIMRIFDIIDDSDPLYGDYELVLVDPDSSLKNKELWAKYQEVRQINKQEAKLIRLLYD